MYLNYYGLDKEPFHITPDPEFLFLSPSHKEALGAILYGVEKRKGFISITGEIGMGKTTVVRAFIDECDQSRNRLVYIFNTGVDFVSLLRMLIEELSPETAIEPGADESRLLDQLQRILIEEYSAGRTVVLVIDDAQAMPVQTLEQLRLLSNLETSKDKLLQIVLVGQPELEQKLESAELRQLRQRIAVRAVIRPLTARESRDYIQHRLALAGGKGAAIFSAGALKSIVRFAKGAPRLLNIICDNALIAGFAEQQSSITRKLIRHVIRDYQARSTVRTTWIRRPATALAGLALVILAVVMLGSNISLSSQQTQLSDRNQPLLPAAGATAVSSASPVSPAAPAVAVEAAKPASKSVEKAAEPETVPPAGRQGGLAASLAQQQSADVAKPAIAASTAAPARTEGPIPTEPRVASAAKTPQPSPAAAPAAQTPGVDATSVSMQSSRAPQDVSPVATAGESSVDRLEQPLKKDVSDHTFTVEVLPGDCVSMILKAHFQSVSHSLMARVKQLNPSLQNFDQIYPGEQLILPLGANASGSRADGNTRIVQAD
ncbi:ExeA family protein [Oceanidesulfovibrio marinus]|uniref:AAA+ ATPase domain-containing protein n=1 Tax=Oceanidesulfovibrio marinus TaxID=370038 RepID=A0ABX6NCD5_9BACT|nr:AAA family ATPase [Oceanidesulfovibrio marinus]QJT07733.1 hypothetical protein E8L03_01780 [Oceanidesulfovibrio marinus]